MKLFILAILMGFPLLEGVVLYKLAAGPDGHGWWVTAWLIFAAIAGIALIKQARFAMIARLAAALQQGHFSLAAVIDSFRTVIAGLLLIFPGVISDVMALILLLIPIREPAFERAAGPAPAHRGPVNIIDGEFHRES